ncbi:MAG: Asp-tRNA(Asn)/Glu-tRNA(Gln) amidotransferase subunit GatC [Chloroflexota bacterium]|nr:Asp-tRNA(Asn)/Glu-tRNA(Gln) amidotransferase subunit GatC [Chloroflexota bacterium]
MKLTTEEVRHIALLARLGLDNAEIDKFREQLSHILESFEALQQVDTSDVEPTSHSVPLQNILREDIAQPSLSASEVLANAPDQDEDYLKVHAVLE